MRLIRLEPSLPATPQPIRVRCGVSSGDVSITVGDTSRPAFPRASTVRVHALGPPLLSEVSSPLLPVAPRPSDHSCWGSFPLRDITDGVYAPRGHRVKASRPPHDSREDPPSRFVPSSGFLNLSTACSAFGFAGLFHPAATSRVLIRPGVSPVAQRSSTRRRGLPPCRCCAPTGRRPGRHERASRLRGFVPCNEAFLRVRV